MLNVLYAEFNKAGNFRNVAVSERGRLRAPLETRIKPGGLKAALSGRAHLCAQFTRSLSRAFRKLPLFPM